MQTLASRTDQDALLERDLPSGRRLIVRSAGAVETLEIQSNDRKVEVTILLTPDGPVIQATARRLEMDATDDVSVRCKRFEVRAEEADIETTGAIRLDGEYVFLNCDGPDEDACGGDADA